MAKMESKQIVLGRRKKTMLTLDQKLSLIFRAESGETPQNLAKIYQIGEQTARDIIRQKEKIRKFVGSCESSDGLIKRKSMKVSSFEELDESMLRWYNENRTAGIPVTSAMCIEQAKFLHEQLGLRGSFSASAGWLSRFKQRYGIAGVYSHSAAKTGNAVAAYTFSYQFQQMMQKEDLLPDQIYNADETGLYWKATPGKLSGTDAGSTSASGERVSIICCTNASGTHKLDLTVIGKNKCPWGEEARTSVNYYEMKGGWGMKEIFRHWFEYRWLPDVSEFLASKGLPQRAVLLLDTSPCHITENALGCNGMTVSFLPSDVANLLQPIQQGIASLMKWNYRKDLVNELKAVQTKDYTNNRTLEEAVQALEQSWANISTVAIKNAWSKLLSDTDQYVVENEIVGTTNDMLVDHETDLVEEVEDMDEIEDVGEVVHLPQGFIQVEEVEEEYQDIDTLEEQQQQHQVEQIVLDAQQHQEQEEQEQEQHQEHVGVVEWFGDSAVVVKNEDFVQVGVEYNELNAQAVENDDASGDEGADRRIELQTALTSVETLLGFVDLKGLAPNDKKAFKKIRLDIRNLMKSIQSQKQ